MDDISTTLLSHAKTLAEHGSILEQHAHQLGELRTISSQHNEELVLLRSIVAENKQVVAEMRGSLTSVCDSLEHLRDGLMRVTLYTVLALIVVAIGTRAFEAFIKLAAGV